MVRLKIKQCQRSFMRILDLKQQSDIIRCLDILKVENSLFSNKLFSCILHDKRTVYTAEKDD